ncbi:ABC transporter permease [Halorubraceae archaeon YAN]|nr:ABC transporter permease [Halorubraceae archaeon YAN]
MSTIVSTFFALFARELKTAMRTRVYYLITAGVIGLLLALTAGGGGAATGYVPTVVDLLLPLEVLVPVLAIAIGYRSVVSDLERGELAVLKTYDVPSSVYVFAIYAGRAVVLSVILGSGLLATLLLVSFSSGPDTSIFATHTGLDSPLLFARFIVLTLVFALALLAIVLLMSVAAQSTLTAIALAVGAVVLVVVGGDAAIILGLTDGWIAEADLLNALAIAPNSAYRGAVFETVIAVTAASESGYGSPFASVSGLFVWTILSLILATLILHRRTV